jgi:hypothetical protein
MPRAYRGVALNHEICSFSTDWTRHGTEDFLVHTVCGRGRPGRPLGGARPTLNLMGDWSSDELTSKPEKIRA